MDIQNTTSEKNPIVLYQTKMQHGDVTMSLQQTKRQYTHTALSFSLLLLMTLGQATSTSYYCPQMVLPINQVRFSPTILESLTLCGYCERHNQTDFQGLKTQSLLVSDESFCWLGLGVGLGVDIVNILWFITVLHSVTIKYVLGDEIRIYI